ncbi:universal stress protein [Chloroflexota bacterium]
MYERILVALDGSKVGETALPYVEDLVSKMSPDVEVEVTLLQVLSPITQPVVRGEAAINIPISEKEMGNRKDLAADYLNKVGESLRSRGAAVTARVAVGNPPEEIVKAAEEIDVNFIAMSTHGRSGLGRWAFGSVTDRVLRMGGQIPIIMVKAQK